MTRPWPGVDRAAQALGTDGQGARRRVGGWWGIVPGEARWHRQGGVLGRAPGMAPPEPVEAASGAGQERKVWKGLWACGSWDKAGLSFWKFEQKSDRQGRMGAGRAGERQVEGLGVLGREAGGRLCLGEGCMAGGTPEGQAGAEGRAGLPWSCPEVLCPRAGGPRPGEEGELSRLWPSAQKPPQGSLLNKGGVTQA